MGAEVQHRIGLPHLLQIGVVGGEAVVGAGAAGIEQPHRVALVAKGWLHTHKHVAEVAAVDQQVGAVAVQVAGGLAPVFFQALGIGGEPLVFLHAHAVGDRELRCPLKSFRVVDHRLHQRLGRARHVLHVIALGLHLLQHPEDRAEYIQVGRRADVALIRGEAKYRDRQLLFSPGLDPQGGPADCALGDRLNPVLQGVGFTGGVVAAAEHDWLNCAIEFRDGDLQRHLHRVKTEIALLPLLGGLEHQRQRHHVGAI